MASELAQVLMRLPFPKKQVIFLKGELGVGKTTFSQAFLRALGVKGPVKSPTYSLLLEYSPPKGKVYHLDLYRLQSDEELYLIGLFDHLKEEAFFLIEWPERLAAFGIQPDWIFHFDLHQDIKTHALHRTVRIIPL